MKLTDLNANGGIGANSLFIEIGEFRIIVDAGLHPKYMGADSLPKFDRVPDGTVDLIIITHCHLDHLGGLPVLLRHQPQAKVLMSHPSRMLAPHMMHNSVNVMLRQREEHSIPELPLFTHHEVDSVESAVITMPYAKPRQFDTRTDALEITFYQAGHVAGAAGFSIRHKHRKIFFTGDVLFTEQMTLPGARFPDEEFDTLIMETTNGHKDRPLDNTRQSEIARLIKTLDHVLSHGGSCLVPVFALGRMQEIVTILLRERREGRLRECPIFCTGMGLELANVYDQISKKTGLVKFNRKTFKELKTRKPPKNMKPGQSDSEPALYIVSSGMMVARTPSYGIAASLLPHKKNALCFVGYCDPETPGGELLATEHGDTFIFETLDYACPVLAHVEKFDLTGHAERNELLNFALTANPRAIVLTHGDPPAREWFHNELMEASGNTRIINPNPLETVLV